MNYLATQRGLAVEAIRQTEYLYKKEALIAAHLELTLPWILTPTPKFYFSDYHITEKAGDYGNYIGDLELKWVNGPSSIPVHFDYEKIQIMAGIRIPGADNPSAYHRVCFRFDDGLLMLPINALDHLKPSINTGKQPGYNYGRPARLVVKIQAEQYPLSCFKPIKLNSPEYAKV